jgi:hypothetical protein
LRWITSPGLPDPVRVFSTTCPTPFRDAHELIGSVTQDRMLEVTTVAVDPDRRRPLTDSGRAGPTRSGVVHDLRDQSAFTDHQGGWKRSRRSRSTTGFGTRN